VDPLSVEDPTLAVLLERMTRLQQDVTAGNEIQRADMQRLRTDLRTEMKVGFDRSEDQINHVQAEIEDVKKNVSTLYQFVSHAKGGYIVLIALGGIMMWLFGVWDKIIKIFQ
jgi:hypothetical protein